MIASTSSFSSNSDSSIESTPTVSTLDDVQDIFIGYKTIFNLAGFDTLFKPIVDLGPIKTVVANPNAAATHPLFCELNTSALGPMSMKNASFARRSPYATIPTAIINVPVTGIVTMPRAGNSHALQGVLDAYNSNKISDVNSANRPIQGILSGLSGLYKTWSQDLSKRILPLSPFANFVRYGSYANIASTVVNNNAINIINVDIYSRVLAVGNGTGTFQALTQQQVDFIKTAKPLLIDYRVIIGRALTAGQMWNLFTQLTGDPLWNANYVLVDYRNSVGGSIAVFPNNVPIGNYAKLGADIVLEYLYWTMSKEDFFTAMVLYPSANVWEDYSYSAGFNFPLSARTLIPEYDFFDHFDSLPTSNAVDMVNTNINFNIPGVAAHSSLKYYNTLAWSINRMLTQMSAYQMGVPVPLPRLPTSVNNLSDTAGITIYNVASPFQYSEHPQGDPVCYNMLPWELLVLLNGTMSSGVQISYPSTVRSETQPCVATETVATDLVYLPKDHKDNRILPGWTLEDEGDFIYSNVLGLATHYDTPDKIFPGGPVYISSILDMTYPVGLETSGVHAQQFLTPHVNKFVFSGRQTSGLRPPGKV